MKEYFVSVYDSSLKDAQIYLIEAENPDQAREAVRNNYEVQGWPISDLGPMKVTRIIRSQVRHEYKATSILLLGKASHLLPRVSHIDRPLPFD